jgi:protein O-GlcNAc transferase
VAKSRRGRQLHWARIRSQKKSPCSRPSGSLSFVTTSLEDYEAFGLAAEHGRSVSFKAIRAKLARNRNTYPLFDTDRFCRHLESAFSQMWEIKQRGELPHGFSVESMGK